MNNTLDQHQSTSENNVANSDCGVEGPTILEENKKKISNGVSHEEEEIKESFLPPQTAKQLEQEKKNKKNHLNVPL